MVAVPLPPDDTATFDLYLNNQGQVAGDSWNAQPDGSLNSFVWTSSSGTATIASGPSGYFSQGVYAENNQGQVLFNTLAADAATGTFTQTLHLWSPGQSIVTVPLAAGDTFVRDLYLNDQGQVAGDSWGNPQGTGDSFVWTQSAGTIILSTGQPAYFKGVCAENNLGQVLYETLDVDAGTGLSRTSLHLWGPAQTTVTVPLPGSDSSVGSVYLNDQGQVAGDAGGDQGTLDSFVWTQSAGTAVISSTWGDPLSFQGVYAENNQGQVLYETPQADRTAVSLHLWSPGQSVVTIPLPAGDTFTGDLFLNDQGQVAGDAGEYPQGFRDSFLWNQATRTALLVQSGNPYFRGVYGLNNQGQVLYETEDVDAATGTSQTTIQLWSPDAVDTVAPTGSIDPLFSFSPASFTVSWTTSHDNPGGSGIASYSVYASDNGGPFLPLLIDTTQTSIPFTGQEGHTYGFYCIATDNVGQVQVTPATAQMTTQVDIVPPTSSVAALPSYSRGSFTVNWSGQDDSGGSGIASYNVYVSDNGSAFAPVLTDTTQTSITYQGLNGHVYGFYSVATDAVGNVQATPATAQTTTQVDAIPPTSSVAPLPTFTLTNDFTVSWSGIDDAGGSGIATYNIYVSDNGGAFLPFLLGTTQTSATFHGAPGNTYGFYSRATDLAGNQELAPTSAQATATIQALPTITWANPADMIFGTALDATQLDASANVPGTFSYSPASGTILSAGNNQTLTVSFTPSDPIRFLPAAASVAINVLKATPMVTWANPADLVYGTALSATQLDATANVPGSLSYNPASGTVLHAGSNQTLSVTFTPDDATDYTTTTSSVALNVLKATPVLSWANPADIVFGTALSATQLDATANVPGSFSYSPASGTVPHAGSNQTLSVTFTPDDAIDYSIATASVTVNVLKATPVLNWPNPADIVFGTALSATQLDATANVPGSFSYSPASGTVLHAGNNQMLTVTFNPDDAIDYSIATASVTVNVLKATPVLSWPNPADIVYGTALSATQLNATANVPGSLSYNPASGTVLHAGSNQTLSVTFTPDDAADYTTTTSSVALNVLKATPVLSWANPADIVFGSPLGDVQLNASANVPGAFSYNPGSGTVLPAGANQDLTATFTPVDTTDYSTATAGVAINVIPTIQPVSQSAFAGTVVSFQAVTGLPTPTVQWQQSIDGGTFTNIDGATSATYTFVVAAAQAGSGYRYQAVLTTPGGHVTTNAATLAVRTDLTILTRPTPQTVPIGQKATFTATGGGTTRPTVQWQVSSDNGSTYSNISGATSTTLTFPVTAAQNGNLYRAVFSNKAGQAATVAVPLTVNFTLQVGKPAQTLTVASGTPVTLVAAALGSPSATVQWMVSTDRGTSYTAIPNATSLSYTFTPQLSDSGKLYQAVFSQPKNTRTGVVTLTVDVPPAVTDPAPGNQTVAAGTTQKATFNASASGTPAPKVQWQVSSDGGLTFTDVAGATSTKLTLSNLTASQDGNRYRAVFSNPVGQASSAIATLTVNYVPIITLQPKAQTVIAGNMAAFTAAAQADPAATVQWQVSSDGGKNFQPIPGATLAIYSFPVQATDNGKYYQAVFTNAQGVTRTVAVALKVPPAVSSNPSSQTVTAGQTATFTALASGTPAPKVQWQVSSDGGKTWSAIPGATSTTLTLSKVKRTQNGGKYRALFTNSGGQVYSSVATLLVN